MRIVRKKVDLVIPGETQESTGSPLRASDMARTSVGACHCAHRDGMSRRQTSAEQGARVLGSGDFAMFSVLGIVREGVDTLGEIVAAAQALAWPDWRPTSELLAGAVNDALQRGLLRATGTPGETAPRLSITTAGEARLTELLHSPVASSRGSLGRTAAALKICFLGALDRSSRAVVLQGLASSYSDELAVLRREAAACPAARPYPRRWMAREAERLEQQVNWLQGLQADLHVDAAGEMRT